MAVYQKTLEQLINDAENGKFFKAYKTYTDVLDQNYFKKNEFKARDVLGLWHVEYINREIHIQTVVTFKENNRGVIVPEGDLSGDYTWEDLKNKKFNMTLLEVKNDK
jgi:hypothetical protein